jgi:hypothetical protein
MINLYTSTLSSSLNKALRTLPYDQIEYEGVEYPLTESAPPELPVSQPTPPLYSEVERETVKPMMENINRACHLTAEQISIIRRYSYNITRGPWGLPIKQRWRRGRGFRPRDMRRPARSEYQSFD